MSSLPFIKLKYLRARLAFLNNSNSSLFKSSLIDVNIDNKVTKLFSSSRVKKHYVCVFHKHVIATIQELETSDMICPIGPQIHIKRYKLPYLYLCFFATIIITTSSKSHTWRVFLKLKHDCSTRRFVCNVMQSMHGRQ